MLINIAQEPDLLVDDIAEATLKGVARERWIAIGLNAVAVAVALFAPLVAVGLYLVGTTGLLLIPLVGLRRHRRQRRAA